MITTGKIVGAVVAEAGFLLGVYWFVEWLDAATPVFWLFLGLQAAFFLLVSVGHILWLRPLPGTPELERERARRAQRRVLVCWHGGALALVIVVALAVWQRATMDPGSAALYWVSVAVLCGALVWTLVADWRFDRARGHRPPTVIQTSAVLMLVPIVAAWILTSGSWHMARPSAPKPLEAELRKVRDARATASDQEPVTIAMTLSGGSYRASAFHAGVLEQLDHDRIPIRYLSTNSGGSIIGAYYALGHTPEEFIARYAANGGPGLPNDFFAFDAVVRHFADPGFDSGDMFTRHLDRVFFASRTLQTGCAPRLLINVTDYGSGAGRTYACPGAGKDGEVPVARAVAASGALPGIVSAVQILGEPYMDGASRDNLGYIGLQAYLGGEPGERQPGFLIMSNATLPLGEEKKPLPRKVWLGAAFLRSHIALLDEERRQVIEQVKAHARRGVPPGAKGLATSGVTPDQLERAVADLRAEVASDPDAARVIRREPATLEEFRRNSKIFAEVRQNPKVLDAFLHRGPSRAAAVGTDAARRLASLVVGGENAYAVVLTLADAGVEPVSERYLACSKGRDESARKADVQQAARLNPFHEPSAEQMELVRCIGRTMAAGRRIGCRLDAVRDLKDPDAICGVPAR